MSTTTSIVHRPWLLGGQRGGLPPSLDLKFLGALDPRITFTRASTATYFDSSGTMQTAASGAPRFDYDPASHVLRGLLIEEARTNLLLWSTDFTNAVWQVFNSATKGGAVTGPGGVATGRTINFAAVGASQMFQSLTIPSGATMSVWARANTLNQFFLRFSNDGDSPVFNLTGQWQRFSFTASTALNGNVAVEGPGSAGSIDIALPQLEAGGFPTSYVGTAGATAARANDYCLIPGANTAPWFVSPGGSWAVEFINIDTVMVAGKAGRIIGQSAASGVAPLYVPSSLLLSQYDGGVVASANTLAPNVVVKAASTWAPGTGRVCLNAGPVASGALASGYPQLTGGVAFFASGSGTVAEDMNGYLRRVRYWPRVLSNAELQSVTR